MEFVKHYMADDSLRAALNALTRQTFGFDFEKWYAGGGWEGDYLPYSLMDGGKMIANVSANRMRFCQNGQERRYIQIGTVMTDKAYRRRGLAAQLMRAAMDDLRGECDGFYLFGNLSALGFRLGQLRIRGPRSQNVRFRNAHQLLLRNLRQGGQAIGLFHQQLFKYISHTTGIAERNGTGV